MAMPLILEILTFVVLHQSSDNLSFSRDKSMPSASWNSTVVWKGENSWVGRFSCLNIFRRSNVPKHVYSSHMEIKTSQSHKEL